MGEETPIFETLKQNECYIISKTKDSILVLSNHAGLVGLTRIPIPETVKKVSRLALSIGTPGYNCPLCSNLKLIDKFSEIKVLSHVRRHVKHMGKIMQIESVEEGLRALFGEVDG